MGARLVDILQHPHEITLDPDPAIAIGLAEANLGVCQEPKQSRPIGYVQAGSIIGVGTAKKVSAVRWSVAREIVTHRRQRQLNSRRLRTTHDLKPMPLATSITKSNAPFAFVHLKGSLSSNA